MIRGNRVAIITVDYSSYGKRRGKLIVPGTTIEGIRDVEMFQPAAPRSRVESCCENVFSVATFELIDGLNQLASEREGIRRQVVITLPAVQVVGKAGKTILAICGMNRMKRVVALIAPQPVDTRGRTRVI